MIEFDDVRVGYGKKIVLENISFTAESGEITVILGKNGCGKSTLMRAAAGNLAYSGSIKLDKLEISGIPPKKRARMLAVMPQLLARPSISVRELVSYGRQPYAGFMGRISESDSIAAESAMEKAGLKPLADARADSISGGELQRVYLAMLLAQNTPNEILDEPAAHLDVSYERRAAEFLLQEKREGKAVLAVYHNLASAVEIADKLIVISGGGIAFAGTAAEFVDGGISQKLFGLNKYSCVSEDGKKRIFFA